MQRKYLGFLSIHTVQKKKKRGTGHSKQFKGMQRTVTFLGTSFFKGKYVHAKEDTVSVKNGINMGNGFIPVAVTPRIKLCWVPHVVERVNVAFDMLIWKTKIF